MYKDNPFSFCPAAAGACLILASGVSAQTLSTLHSFNGSDGSTPVASLVLSNNTLYGTAWTGGSGSAGTIFAVNTDRTGFTNLYSFTTPSGPFPHTNSDGGTPNGLILSGQTLYGTAKNGGNSGVGTVFAINVDGTGFTNLHTFTALSVDPPFTNSDGANPAAGLILSGSTLYGTATGGGNSGSGTIFAMSTDGTSFTTLYSFSEAAGPFPGTNNDGAAPNGLTLSGGTLYGTAQFGGNVGNGTIFAINTGGTGFATLYDFSATSGSFPGPYTNLDGANPYGDLISSGQTLYGTAVNGGVYGNGTAFAFDTTGNGFARLHSFTPISMSDSGASTNVDGANPYGGLILSGQTLYGTATGGGILGYGTVFSLNSDGTKFSTLYDFTAPAGPYPPTNSDGASPQADLIISGDTLYGTASAGGSSGLGSVFSLSLGAVNLPQLTILQAGPNVVLSWPANITGFTLQASSGLVSPLWTTVSPGPVVVNGQNTVTNVISGTRMSYRLMR